jgi:ribosome maturation protein SDO1
MAGTTFDPEKFQLSIARLKHGGHVFEVVVDPDEALAYKEKNDGDISKVIKYEKIFVDAQKGQLASENLMNDVFESVNILEISETILKKGEVHLTTKYKQELRDRVKKQIVGKIHAYGVDPRTNAPHPIERIERALEEAKVRIDEFKTVDDQVQEIIKSLRPVLPISFEKKMVRILLPTQYAHKAYGVVKSMSKIQKETWETDGSWTGEIEIPAGIEQELYDKLNSITHGSLKTETLETKKV